MVKQRVSGMTPAQAAKMGELVPIEQWQERLAAYRKLRRLHFTPDEAMDVVTATAPKGGLQPLAFDTDLWKQHIEERQNWYRAQMKAGIARGWTPAQAGIKIRRMLVDLHRRKDDIFDWFKEVYKYRRKPDIDFMEGQRLRRIRMSRKKMPYRATRIR